MTFGLFYSAFREETWWWEGTVAVRKIGVEAIGVLGVKWRPCRCTRPCYW